MPSSYKTVADFLIEYQKYSSIEKLLSDSNRYWAHTPKQQGEQAETLEEHLHLVQTYFEKIVRKHHSHQIINNLIDEYLKEKNFVSEKLGNWIKQLFVHTILYHDHGKVNENFQKFRMSNPAFDNKQNSENGIGTEHSTLSSFIFLNHKLSEAANKFEKREQQCAFVVTILYSYSIYRHHSYHLKDDYWQKIIDESKRHDQLQDYLKLFHSFLPDQKVLHLLKRLNVLKGKSEFKQYESSFALYQLIRLSFSLLTASDYLATNEYSSGFSIEDLGTLDFSRVEALYNKVTQEEWIDKSEKKRNFNKNTYDDLLNLDLEKKPKTKSAENLNKLRQQMATEAIRNIKRNTHQNLFYLEAPTGGGKTNISMLMSLELLKANVDLNKVFYVFPFTTLIDQTFKSFKETLDLSDDEIIALHSRASFDQSINDEDETDAEYGEERRNYINRLFVNFPFTLLSHIRFFNLLKSNIKEENYLLHRLANSVVVIDELQSYNPKQWDKLIYFIKRYSDLYNMRFILMSATLPKIGNLEIKGLNVDDIIYLLPNAKTDYFNNVNFAGRIDFDYSLSNERVSLDVLAERVIEESKRYAMLDGDDDKPKDSVHTVVEFIFKNPATLFEKEVEKINNGFFDDIFVLSGTILSHRRKYIINYLKNKSNRSKKTLLITTQVVEAGVDIDMDIGFKDSSLLDSDEQLAGRINRNVKKNDCKLFLFNHSKESVIYGKDLRYEVTKQLTQEEKENILNTKDFDFLYQKIIDFKNKRNQDQNFVGITEYIHLVENLQFQSIYNEFKLIEQENFSCFIPLSLPISIPGEMEGEMEEFFFKSELKFLAVYGIYPDEEGKISGEKIFDLYLKLINSSNDPFTKKIQLKQMHSLLSKFVFSLFASDKTQKRLIEFMDIEKSEYGFFYMNRWEEFYSETSGIDEHAFENVENQFL